MKLVVCKIFSFDAAHFLPYHEGKCRNLHGHTYKLEVEVSRPHEGRLSDGPQCGMVVDFGLLKEVVTREVLDLLDHTYLNDLFENPTAEEVLSWIKTKLINCFDLKGLQIERLRLWETPDAYAEVRYE